MWFFSSGHAMDKYRHGEQPFAFVTGSSLGIGRAIALELVALKYNIVLHAIAVEELVTVREEIQKRRLDTKVVCLAQDTGVKVDWPHVMSQLADLNITVLINNVETVIQVNTIFPTQLTRDILPILIRNYPSLILNMASASVYAPLGFLSVYCGSKAYNLAWSQALYNELRLLRRYVECKAVMTGSVISHGNSVPVSTFVLPTEVYAKSMLARAGSSGPVYNGYWRHSVEIALVRFMRFLSPTLLDTIAADVAKGLLV